MDLAKEQPLFPGQHCLANLILAELGLPTSNDLSAAQFKASLTGHYAFCEGDKEKTKSADFEASLYSDINPLRDVQMLYQREKERTLQALTNVTKKHDDFLRKFQGEFPKFSDLMWQVFRRTGYIASYYAEYALENKDKPKSEYKYAIDPRTDEERVGTYIALQSIHLPNGIEEMLKSPRDYRLVEFDKGYFMGIGRYAFAGKNNDIFQTIWDMRQEKVQFFNYPKATK